MVDPSEMASSQKAEAKPARRPRPSFGAFLESLKEATVKPPKIGLAQVRRLLKVGFAEKEEPHLIGEVADVMEAYVASDRWAVSVASIEVRGLSRTVQQKVLEDVRSRFARKIGIFDLDLDSPGVAQRLAAWLLGSTRGPEMKAKVEETGKHESQSDGPADIALSYESRLRWALVWFLSKASAERRSEAILALIENWAEREEKGQTGRNSEGKWNRFIAGVLSAEKPKSSKVSPLLNALSSLRAQLSSSLGRELVRSGELAKTQEDLETLREKAEATQRELVDAQDALERNEAAVIELERKLADADDRYRSLDEHWKRSSSTNLARKVGSLSEEVGHEVQEAILSLDRETPNVPMALSRLRRLDAIVKRQTRRNDSER